MKKHLIPILLFLLIKPSILMAANDIYFSENDSTVTPKISGVSDYVWQKGWNYASLDRMSMLTNSGDYGFYGPQAMFLLDGIPFDPSFFGVAYSQHFPLPYFLTSQIELKNGHGVLHGINYHAGLMNIQSESVKDGLSVFGSGQYGHNSGEPGPWVFDPDRVSPNVERFGPWINGGVSFKLGNWYAKGFLKFQEYKHVDEFVQLRMINSRRSPTDPSDWLGVDTRSLLRLAETGFTASWISVKVQAYQSESEDFLFFQPFAREIPAEFEVNQYSALSTIHFTPNVGIRGLFQYREQGLNYRLNRFDYNFDWKKEMNSIRGSLFYLGDRFQADIGTEYELTDITAPGLSEYERIITTIFVNQELQIVPQFLISATAQVQVSGDNTAHMAGGSFSIDPSSFWNMNLAGSYSELLPEVAHPLEHQVNSGYYIFDHLDIPFELPGQIKNTRKVSFSNHHQFTMGDMFSLGLSAEWMHHISMNIPFQAALYDLEFSTMPGNFSLLPEISGQRLIAGADVQFIPLRNMVHRAAITLQRTLGGDQEYETYWKMIPDFMVQYSIDYTPYSDVNLVLNLQYRSETTWNEFSNLDGELNRTFHVQYPFRFFEFSDTTPKHFNIDLKMGKWFWGQRLRGELVLKNLLNTNYQTHPLGIRERFGYMARVEMRF